MADSVLSFNEVYRGVISVEDKLKMIKRAFKWSRSPKNLPIFVGSTEDTLGKIVRRVLSDTRAERLDDFDLSQKSYLSLLDYVMDVQCDPNLGQDLLFVVRHYECDARNSPDAHSYSQGLVDSVFNKLRRRLNGEALQVPKKILVVNHFDSCEADFGETWFKTLTSDFVLERFYFHPTAGYFENFRLN